MLAHARVEGAATSAHAFNKLRECARLTGADLWVTVPPDQRRSGQDGTESCGRDGNVVFEA